MPGFNAYTLVIVGSAEIHRPGVALSDKFNFGGAVTSEVAGYPEVIADALVLHFINVRVLEFAAACDLTDILGAAGVNRVACWVDAGGWRYAAGIKKIRISNACGF